MPLGLGRRPDTQGQSNHPTRFQTIPRRRSTKSWTIYARHDPFIAWVDAFGPLAPVASLILTAGCVQGLVGL